MGRLVAGFKNHKPFFEGNRPHYAAIGNIGRFGKSIAIMIGEGRHFGAPVQSSPEVIAYLH